jgi:hypothetical protein
MGLQDTASKTGLLLECQRPFSDEVEIEPDEPGEAARYGSAWHEGLSLRAKGKTVKPNALAEKWEVSGDGLGRHIDDAWKKTESWIAKERLRIIQVETPQASLVSCRWQGPIDVKTRPVAFDEAEHQYDLEEGEFGGTPDLVLEGESYSKKGKRRVVLDYKSGAEVSPDPKTPQLLSLSVMVDASRVAIMHYPKTSLPVIYADDVSSGMRADFARHRMQARARIGDGSLRPGPWCRRCPARDGCPAQHGELLEKTVALVQSAGALGLSLEGVDVGAFHQTWSQIEKLVKVARDQIKERVAEGEVFERPDGKVLTLQQTRPYETVSMSSIREALGDQKASKEIERLRKLGVLRQVNPEPKLVAK